MGAYAEEEDQTFDDFKDIGCCKLAVKNYFLHIFFVLLINTSSHEVSGFNLYIYFYIILIMKKIIYLKKIR